MIDDAMKFLFVPHVQSSIEGRGVLLREGDPYEQPAPLEIPAEISGYPLEIAQAFYQSPESAQYGVRDDAGVIGVKFLLHLASAKIDIP